MVREGSQYQVLASDKSLGYRFERGISRTASKILGPDLTLLNLDIQTIKSKYVLSNPKTLRQLPEFVKDCEDRLQYFGPRLWPSSPPSATSDWLLDANEEGCSPLWQRNLWFEIEEDRNELRERFIDNIASKVIRYQGNQRTKHRKQQAQEEERQMSQSKAEQGLGDILAFDRDETPHLSAHRGMSNGPYYKTGQKRFAEANRAPVALMRVVPQPQGLPESTAFAHAAMPWPEGIEVVDLTSSVSSAGQAAKPPTPFDCDDDDSDDDDSDNDEDSDDEDDWGNDNCGDDGDSEWIPQSSNSPQPSNSRKHRQDDSSDELMAQRKAPKTRASNPGSLPVVLKLGREKLASLSRPPSVKRPYQAARKTVPNYRPSQTIMDHTGAKLNNDQSTFLRQPSPVTGASDQSFKRRSRAASLRDFHSTTKDRIDYGHDMVGPSLRQRSDSSTIDSTKHFTTDHHTYRQTPHTLPRELESRSLATVRGHVHQLNALWTNDSSSPTNSPTVNPSIERTYGLWGAPWRLGPLIKSYPNGELVPVTISNAVANSGENCSEVKAVSVPNVQKVSGLWPGTPSLPGRLSSHGGHQLLRSPSPGANADKGNNEAPATPALPPTTVPSGSDTLPTPTALQRTKIRIFWGEDAKSYDRFKTAYCKSYAGLFLYLHRLDPNDADKRKIKRVVISPKNAAAAGLEELDFRIPAVDGEDAFDDLLELLTLYPSDIRPFITLTVHFCKD